MYWTACQYRNSEGYSKHVLHSEAITVHGFVTNSILWFFSKTTEENGSGNCNKAQCNKSINFLFLFYKSVLYLNERREISIFSPVTSLSNFYLRTFLSKLINASFFSPLLPPPKEGASHLTPSTHWSNPLTLRQMQTKEVGMRREEWCAAGRALKGNEMKELKNRKK